MVVVERLETFLFILEVGWRGCFQSRIRRDCTKGNYGSKALGWVDVGA